MVRLVVFEGKANGETLRVEGGGRWSVLPFAIARLDVEL
jgi:hypothetical protein